MDDVEMKQVYHRFLHHRYAIYIKEGFKFIEFDLFYRFTFDRDDLIYV